MSERQGPRVGFARSCTYAAGIRWDSEAGVPRLGEARIAHVALVTGCAADAGCGESIERFPPEHADGRLRREMGPVIPQRLDPKHLRCGLSA